MPRTLNRTVSCCPDDSSVSSRVATPRRCRAAAPGCMAEVRQAYKLDRDSLTDLLCERVCV
jgi:hypothetical protein